MRISNSMIYDTNMRHMQTSLANYMESTIQGGTQKKINRPSDDPAGAALVLNTRTEILATEQYESNLGTARSWLSTTEASLQKTSETVRRIITLTEQAATGTMSPENREQISFELEQLFGQLINLSNTEVEGNSVFGGHNYLESAFDEGMGVMSRDEDFDAAGATVNGKADNSIALHFLTDGVVGTDALDYQWSDDGGDTWTTESLAAGQTSLNAGGVTLNMRPGTEVKGATNPDPSDELNSKDGTFLYLYPTAVYNGDDNDASAYAAVQNGVSGLAVDVQADLADNVLFELTAAADLSVPGSDVTYRTSIDGGTTWVDGTAKVPNPVTGQVQLPITDSKGNTGYVALDTSSTAIASSVLPANFSMDLQPRRVDMLNGPSDISLNSHGIFSQNTAVRIDETVDLAAGGLLNYSYSIDGGENWVKASSQMPVPNPDGSVSLALPGGFLELSTQNGGSTTLDAGTQMLIHPDRADLGYEVMENTYIPVNQVGKDIFGGMYNGQPVEGANLFESVGKLIAYVENNESDGIAQSLVDIKAGLEHVLTQTARIGGLENRLDLAEGMLDYEKIDQGERLSYTEDIDLTELLNNLAKDELAYSTVLQSSSMILQLNFTKFI